MADLFDSNQGEYKRVFHEALDFEKYVASGSDAQQQRWRDYCTRIELATNQRTVLYGFVRELNILVLSGIWCGDCARQGPMLAAIAAECPKLNLRFVENEAYPELRDQLRIHGAARVPVVLTLSEDFFELNRLGDRTLAAYRRKAANELGPACDAGIVPPSKDELALEIDDWVRHFERLHLMVRLSPFLRKRHGD